VIAVARVVVHVMPKAEILDPQGQAIVGALGRLGFDTLAEIAESLLANTVIEDFSVSREQS
jgi:phosphoribosylformylglycinamidine synthase